MTEDDAAADAPLMQGDSGQEERIGSLGSLELQQEDAQASPTAFIWALTFTAGISGLLFGYDTGVISSTLVSIGSDLSARPLTTVDKSLVTSCTSLFALIASPITAVLADKVGRKTAILVADVLFTIGALWQAWTDSVWGMVGGRSIVGLAVGGASLVVPLYISELSPSAFRGRLVTLSILFITAGQVTAYVVGWMLSAQEHGWRWMVGLGATPAIIQFSLLVFLPETPRWLVKAGRMEKARMVLAKVYGSGSYAIVESVLRAVDREIMEENEATNERNRHVVVPPRYAYTFPWLTHLRSGWNELFRIGSNRRALTIACLLQGLQQLCGFNSLMYFSATIFSLIGFSSPTTPALSIALTNFTFTLLALLLIDRIGRRLILLLSIPIMILALTLCATSFSYLPISTSTSTSTSSPSVSTTPPPSPSPSPSPSLPALLILLAMTLYVSAYALGLGTVPWQQSELFPLSVRSLGSGLATGTNWAGNFIVGLSFLPMMEWLAPAWTFATYAVVCAAGWLCVWRFYPETKGLGLEEVGGLLRDGWGVGRERGGSVGRRRG